MSCKLELPFTCVDLQEGDSLTYLSFETFHFSGFRASCLIRLLNFLLASQPEVMPYLEEMNIIITIMHDEPLSRMVLLVGRQISMGFNVNH
jgi:hypothetical protein